MAFINPKDEIMQMILTQKGREQLSQGKLIIKYYAFHDDEIDYAAQYQERSGAVNPSTGSAPSLLVSPTISVFSTWAQLTGTTGTWANSPTSYTFRWIRSGSFVSAGTGSAYFTTGSSGGMTDYGPMWQLVVTASNAFGEAYATSSNSLFYEPLSESTCHMWRDPSQLTPGAVSSYADRTGNWTGAQGTASQQPSASVTSFNGTPGVSFDGGDILVGAYNPSAYSVMACIHGVVDSDTTVVFHYEHTTNVNVLNGAFAATVNDVAIGSVNAYARGTGGLGGARTDNTRTLATPKVLTRIFTTANSNGTAAIRENGINLSLTDTSTSSSPGNWANVNFHLGARSGPTLGGTFTEGHAVHLSVGTADAAVERVEQYIAYRSGMSPL